MESLNWQFMFWKQKHVVTNTHFLKIVHTDQ